MIQYSNIKYEGLPYGSGKKYKIPILKMNDSLSWTDGMATTPSDFTVTNICISTCFRTVSESLTILAIKTYNYLSKIIWEEENLITLQVYAFCPKNKLFSVK